MRQKAKGAAPPPRRPAPPTPERPRGPAPSTRAFQIRQVGADYCLLTGGSLRELLAPDADSDAGADSDALTNADTDGTDGGTTSTSTSTSAPTSDSRWWLLLAASALTLVLAALTRRLGVRQRPREGR